MKMKESDWKKFVKIKERALEKYCSRVLNEAEALISNENASAHERFLELYTCVKASNKQLADIFDGHSRNGAPFQLMLMRIEGLVEPELLEQLSDEFVEQTKPRY